MQNFGSIGFVLVAIIMVIATHDFNNEISNKTKAILISIASFALVLYSYCIKIETFAWLLVAVTIFAALYYGLVKKDK